MDLVYLPPAGPITSFPWWTGDQDLFPWPQGIHSSNPLLNPVPVSEQKQLNNIMYFSVCYYILCTLNMTVSSLLCLTPHSDKQVDTPYHLHTIATYWEI